MTYEKVVSVIKQEHLKTRMDVVLWLVSCHGELTKAELMHIQEACYKDDLIRP